MSMSKLAIKYLSAHTRTLSRVVRVETSETTHKYGERGTIAQLSLFVTKFLFWAKVEVKWEDYMECPFA